MSLNSSASSGKERRKYSRILFDAQVELRQGEISWHSRLLDISLKGLLLQKTLPNNFIATNPIDAIIFLDDETNIAMSVIVAHQEKNQLGLKCITIDIDSVCHLRRLIELNLGDSSILERELSELSPNEPPNQLPSEA
jgi:hypothetical protein